MSSERVFIVGGTGNVGTRVVQDLLDRKIPVTLFTRTPSKVGSLFGKNDLISVVQGDYYSDMLNLKEGIKNHTRLFLLFYGIEKLVETETKISKIAYDAGVKQIVGISSFTVNLGWRTSYVGSKHESAEKNIMDIPNRGYFVALRPGRFMATLKMMENPLKTNNIISDCIEKEQGEGYISTNDIGAVAAVILSEDVEKHGDAVYSLTGDVVSPNGRAALYSRVFGKNVTYKQSTPAQKYQTMMATGRMTHIIATDVVCGLSCFPDNRVTPEISILLGREPETLEEYITNNKNSYQ